MITNVMLVTAPVGKNIFDYIQGELGYIFLMGIVVVGVYWFIKKETSKWVGMLVMAIICAGLVFAPESAKDWMLSVFNRIIAG
jgi:hypothetical protein